MISAESNAQIKLRQDAVPAEVPGLLHTQGDNNVTLSVNCCSRSQSGAPAQEQIACCSCITALFMLALQASFPKSVAICHHSHDLVTNTVTACTVPQLSLAATHVCCQYLCSLLMSNGVQVRMGFPQRRPEGPDSVALIGKECALLSGGFTCPRCLALVAELPSSCHVCGLTLVSSPHLARSYHHLFPIKPFTEVTAKALRQAMVS